MGEQSASVLEDRRVDVKLKLFALWSSVLSFYIYGDYFELYQPGQLQDMLSGRTVFGATSQRILLGMSASTILASLMPFLCLALPARVNRWVNLVSGVLYTLVMVLAIRGSWHFYVVYGAIEIALTGLIVWFAWRWPKQSGVSASPRA